MQRKTDEDVATWSLCLRKREHSAIRPIAAASFSQTSIEPIRPGLIWPDLIRPERIRLELVRLNSPVCTHPSELTRLNPCTALIYPDVTWCIDQTTFTLMAIPW